MSEQIKSSAPTLRRMIFFMLLIVALVILVTELIEFFLQSSEFVEGLMHVLSLVVVLSPVFYRYWYLPLQGQLVAGKISEKEVRNLSHQLLEARERDRRILARELHDLFGQRIICLQVQINMLQQALTGEDRPSPDLCQPLIQSVNDLGGDLRNVLADLRPGALDELGLVPALETLCAEIAGQVSDLRVDFSCAGFKDRLDREVETALYRVCQEALTNIIKHARANSAQVSLLRSHPSIILAVQDDGVGFAEEGNSDREPCRDSGFGLLGMRERVDAVGGQLRLVSKPGSGVRLRVEIPDKISGGES